MATPNASPLTFQRFPNLPRDRTFDPHDWNIIPSLSVQNSTASRLP